MSTLPPILNFLIITSDYQVKEVVQKAAQQAAEIKEKEWVRTKEPAKTTDVLLFLKTAKLVGKMSSFL